MSIDQQALTASLRRIAGTPAGTDVHNSLQTVIEACVDLFQVTGSGLMLADEQNMTHYVASTDGPGRVLEEAESESGQGVCTEAFVLNRVVDSPDLAEETERWPDLAVAILPYGVRAVLGVPIRMGGIPVGTLDVYRDRRHPWDDSERDAMIRYSEVLEATLTAAMRAHTAAELADQLQYALDYRIVIERAVGFLMARHQIDAVIAFNRLRRAARNNRTKIGLVAEQVLSTGELPGR